MIRCTSCLYPASKPDLRFDDGLCAACRNYMDRPTVDWAQRYRELIALKERAVPNKDGFDCIVPSSGGKDSTAQVLTVLSLGFKPLIVTASTCYLTPMGRRNIDNLKRFAPTVEVHPDYAVRKKLNRMGLEMVGDISHPEHMAIFSVPFRVAADLGIPLVIYGENPQHEYGGPLGAEEALTMTRRWIAEFGGLLGMRADDFVGLEGITSVDMDYYRLPDETDMAKIEAYFLGQFIPWDSQANAKLSIENGLTYELPCAASWWPWENLDNGMTGLHDHGMFRKFGYGRLAGQISADIRRGRVSRREALRIVEDRDGIFPEVYCGVGVDDVLDYLGRDRAWLFEHLDAHTNWDLFSGVIGNRPILKEWIRQAAE